MNAEPAPADSAAPAAPAPTHGAPPAQFESAPPVAPVDTAQATAPGITRVGRLSVVGNALTDSARIVRSFEVPSGSRYSDDALRRGLRKLFALGLFDDVWLERTPIGDVVDVVIHVKERPRISSVQFQGNKHRETSELERKLMLHAGAIYAPTVVQTQVDSLVQFYHDEGFAQATIQAVADTSTTGNQIALRFVVHEGEKVKITKIAFVGVHAFGEKKLRKQMKSKGKGWFGGGDIKPENFELDREKLEAYYRDHGYRDARFVGHELKPGDSSRHLTLVVTIEEGPPYWIGRITWSGNQVVDNASLEKLWTPKPGEKYDASRIEKAQTAAFGDYAEKGYLYLGIEPRESVRDSLVDVAFTISEGRPSTVRMVNIAGNRGTREKVIRREIDIHEGDRFKRSALVRTQGDIFRLGLFEDVKVDFAPAESTDVDINLNVKEKQVGTASAGAGYTSSTGLTGFLELGHNNVLGNGQSIQLHLERGARRNDYSVSFTEPWFRDTPTLLGISAFNTENELDLYTQKRIGGSGRIGRPLPWPDYSRGSLTYQLENVTISQLSGVLTAEEQIALQGIKVGEATLTSSVSTGFLRNNTDNPFYPTKGSRIGIDDEFAGGAFGGSVNFHKHRLEGRVYLPSVLKGVTTMARARLGLLGQYAGQIQGVPAYERFRLGGGSSSDPLRGYDDYQVVPGKFNQIITTQVLSKIDSVTTPGVHDSIYVAQFTRVRYPGGRFMASYTVEQQFPVVHPLHAVLFFDAGNTWDLWREIKPWDLKLGAGIGFRIEIPLLGNIGFDYGYGFDRDDGPRARGHFLIGNVNF